MYYDNKSTFYIKQYGPAVITIVFSFLLIFSGIFIYLKSSTVSEDKSKDIVVADASLKNEDAKSVKENVENKDDNNVVKLNTTTTANSNIPANLEKLDVLEESKQGTFKSINSDGSINLSINNDDIQIYLIGIDFSNSKSNVFSTIESELKNKKLSIMFDTNKIEDSKIYAYLYIDDNTLYNEELLKNGLAKLRIERNNVSLLGTLLEAQLAAKSSNTGIWAKN